MSDIDDLEPLPDDVDFPPVSTLFDSGLTTKRELFALHLMAAHIIADSIVSCSTEMDVRIDTPIAAAKKALKYADALLTALAEETV